MQISLSYGQLLTLDDDVDVVQDGLQPGGFPLLLRNIGKRFYAELEGLTYEDEVFQGYIHISI